MAAFSFRAQVMHTRCSASTCDGVCGCSVCTQNVRCAKREYVGGADECVSEGWECTEDVRRKTAAETEREKRNHGCVGGSYECERERMRRRRQRMSVGTLSEGLR